MRLFSWHGLAALALAAGCGYVAGVGERNLAESPCPPRIPSMEEEATPPPPPPPGLAFGGATIEGVRLDDLDLTCPPHVTLPAEFFAQTVEPPIAPVEIHRATFEFPAGQDDGATVPPHMPYLDDCPNLEEQPHEAVVIPGFTLVGPATDIALGRFWTVSWPQVP